MKEGKNIYEKIFSKALGKDFNLLGKLAIDGTKKILRDFLDEPHIEEYVEICIVADTKMYEGEFTAKQSIMYQLEQMKSKGIVRDEKHFIEIWNAVAEMNAKTIEDLVVEEEDNIKFMSSVNVIRNSRGYGNGRCS